MVTVAPTAPTLGLRPGWPPEFAMFGLNTRGAGHAWPAGSGGLTVNTSVFDWSLPCVWPGTLTVIRTVTGEVFCIARFDWGTVASISVEVSKIVGRFWLFHCTVEPSTKPSPWTSRVNDPEQPAYREEGTIKLICELREAEAPRFGL